MRKVLDRKELAELAELDEVLQDVAFLKQLIDSTPSEALVMPMIKLLSSSNPWPLYEYFIPALEAEALRRLAEKDKTSR